MRKIPILTAAVALAACGNSSSTDGLAPADVTVTGKAVPKVLPIGEHCYFRDDREVTEAVQLVAGGDGSLSGTNFGVIHQDGEGIYSAFEIDLSGGRLTESGLILFNADTRVEGTTRTGSMLWRLSEDAAAPNGLKGEMEPVDCDGLEDRVFPEDG